MQQDLCHVVDNAKQNIKIKLVAKFQGLFLLCSSRPWSWEVKENENHEISPYPNISKQNSSLPYLAKLEYQVPCIPL